MWFLPSGDTFCLENMPTLASGLTSLGLNSKSYQGNAMDRAISHSLGDEDSPRQPGDNVQESRWESEWVFLLQESIPWLCGGPRGEPHLFLEPLMGPPPKPQVQPAMTQTQEPSPSIKQLKWNKIKCRQRHAPKAIQTASLAVPTCGRQAGSESRLAETQQHRGAPWG